MTLAAVRPLNATHTGVHASTHECRSPAKAQLTPNEQAVFELLMLVKSDADIARELQISLRAARYRRRKAVQKLNAATRDEIVVRGRDWDLAVSRLLGE
jgi:DNA-binding NarL/FixJ family response regulator